VRATKTYQAFPLPEISLPFPSTDLYFYPLIFLLADVAACISPVKYFFNAQLLVAHRATDTHGTICSASQKEHDHDNKNNWEYHHEWKVIPRSILPHYLIAFQDMSAAAEDASVLLIQGYSFIKSTIIF
jgi:hypothetical protein